MRPTLAIRLAVTSTQAGSTALAPAWAGGASTVPTGPLISPTVEAGPAAVQRIGAESRAGDTFAGDPGEERLQPNQASLDGWPSRRPPPSDDRSIAMDLFRAPLRAAGRVALAAMFITGGADAMLDPGPRTSKAEEVGVPLDPELAVRANGAAMLAAGTALALGLWPRLAAAVLAGTIVPTTLAGHRYWEIEDPAARRQQRIHFFKNLGLLGGALLVCAERPPRRR
jgi:uncharacterized membrane protein YphA (DoxX/SURF4 family)